MLTSTEDKPSISRVASEMAL